MHCAALMLSPSKFKVTSLQWDGLSTMQTATTSSIIGPPKVRSAITVTVNRVYPGRFLKNSFYYEVRIFPEYGANVATHKNKGAALLAWK